MKTETFLPGFSGFFNTIHKFNEDIIVKKAIDQMMIDYPIDVSSDVIDVDNFIDIDHKRYFEDYALEYTDCIEEFLNDIGITIKFVYQNLYSPREYNFTNDSINVEVEYIPEEIIKLIEENKDEFDGYIEKTYTSRSEFISSHSSDGDEWLKEVKKDGFDEHKLGACLEFILELNDFDELKCSRKTKDGDENYESNYVEIKELDIDIETEELLYEIFKAIEKGESQFAEYSKTMKPDSVDRQREGFNKNIKELKEEYNEVLLNCIVD